MKIQHLPCVTANRLVAILCGTHSRAAVRLALSAALILSALSAQAQSFVNAKYRCGVLGETSSCERSPDLPLFRVEERLELGPRALYFKYLGADLDTAIARARLSVEHPKRRVVRITTRELSSTEKFDRANGRAIRPYETVETLSLKIDFGDEPKAETKAVTQIQRKY